jgi:Holliday junction resolvasome RuvABC DNA-binding subunit
MKTNQATAPVVESNQVEQDFDGAVYEDLAAKQAAEQAANQPKSAAEAVAKYGTKSGAIRALTALGWKRGEIAKFLDIKYQFVRNVQVTPVGKRTELK